MDAQYLLPVLPSAICGIESKILAVFGLKILYFLHGFERRLAIIDEKKEHRGADYLLVGQALVVEDF